MINAENYCRKCNQPLDITGRCSYCSNEDLILKDFLIRLGELNSRKSNICPYCESEIISMKQEGRDVYGSCGCRLFQGKVPQAWI